MLVYYKDCFLDSYEIPWWYFFVMKRVTTIETFFFGRNKNVTKFQYLVDFKQKIK